MFTFKLKEVQPLFLDSIAAGQLFLHKTENEYAVSAMVSADGTDRLICPLNGETAFHFNSIDVRLGRPATLLIPVSVDSLRLRVDETSRASDLKDNPAGRLLIQPDGGACISAEWYKKDREGTPNALQLSNWQTTWIEKPIFGFERWSLSYVDEAGNWQDLITRVPTA